MKESERVKYSVVFLLDKQNENFLVYLNTVIEIFSSRLDSFEIIIIANGTGGFLKKLIEKQTIPNCKIKAFEMSNKASHAVCLKSALKETKGEFIFACGAYQQITSESFMDLLDAVDDEIDIISPWRQNRFDPRFYKMQSNLFNAIVRWITGTRLHDLSCNIRVFRRKVLEETELYGNMYSFFPIYAARKGFKSKEVICKHNKEHGEPRLAKAGLYHLTTYINRLIDIFTLYFNTSFSKKPLRFFISIGMVFILIGVGITIFIVVQKVAYGLPIGNRPIFLLAFFFMLIGIQATSVGLLGEIIVFTHGRKKKEFVIEKII